MRRRLRAVYLMHSIDGFAGSLIGIFIPIYFLTLGYSVSQIFVFYLILYAALAVLFFLAGYLSSRLGLKRTILARLPFLIAYLAMLYWLPTRHIPLSVIALANSFNLAFYWFPLHIIFTRATDHHEMGNNVGKLFALPKLAGIFAPLLGGFLTFAFGFGFLFASAVILYLVSALPLLYADELKQAVEFTCAKAARIFRRFPRYFFGEMINNAAIAVESVIWPIFIFLSFKNVLSIGALGTALGLGGVLFTLLVGRYSDRMDKKILLRLGALLMMAIWFIRYFGQNAAVAYLLTILAGFFSILIIVPFSSISYGAAKKDEEGVGEFILLREVAVNAGRILLFVSAIALAGNIKATFILSGLAHLYFFFF